MTYSIAPALRILSHFWLEEVAANDAEIITALPELAQALPNPDAIALTDLAVEYQRLFGFNLPPYESAFIDPSAMLMAPATRRVQMLYRRGQWNPPVDVRAGAPDHLGLELLAWADWLDPGQTDLVQRLHTHHLALWVPTFILALRRLAPHPFYATLGDLTVDLILTMLPDQALAANGALFPILSPPLSSEQQGSGVEAQAQNLIPLPDSPPPAGDEADVVSLRDIVKRLLPAREVGLFLTREDIARIGQDLNLPKVMGERLRMLESLFQLAGQYDLVPVLFDRLSQLLTEAEAAYQAWAGEYPAWTPYARAWCSRLAATQANFEEMRIIVKEGE